MRHYDYDMIAIERRIEKLQVNIIRKVDLTHMAYTLYLIKKV